jgi:hypothetical protein
MECRTAFVSRKRVGSRECSAADARRAGSDRETTRYSAASLYEAQAEGLHARIRRSSGNSQPLCLIREARRPGPVSDVVQIIGCVSAYHASRATGEILPGLLRAQDVSHFHAAAERIRSIDEPNVKKHEFEEAQKNKSIDAIAGPNQGIPDDAAQG